VAWFWLAPFLPLAAAGVLLGFATGAGGVVGGGVRRSAPVLLVAALAGALALAGVSLLGVIGTPAGGWPAVAVPWLTVGGRRIALALALDPLGAVAAVLVAGVALIVGVYAVTYMADDPHRGRFFGLLSLFVGIMLALVLSADLLMLFGAWELVGFCSYLLIGFWHERPGVPAAATKAFITTRIGDSAMLLGVLLLIGATGSARISDLQAAAQAGRLSPALLLVATLLLLAGAAGKSAQVPLQGWLPDAMRGPTPVSALLHSATMVAAGVFLVARLYPLFLAAGPALAVVAWVGAITALLGGAAALVQTDLKRTLAYSTISQLGFMFAGLGAGSLLAGVLLLVGQALYKALLFLAAGAVDHAVGGTEFARMGGLARRMPGTYLAFTVGAVALAGLPVTLAWPPKDAVLAAAGQSNGPLFAVLLAASGLTGLYAARTLGLVFLGPPSAAGRAATEAPLGLRGPVLALALLVPIGLLVDAGWLGGPLSRLLATPTPEVPWATALGLAVAAAGAAAGLAARYAWPAAIIWPPLVRVAPILAGEFGLVALYRLVPRAVYTVARTLDRFDRVVFDRVAGAGARSTLRAVGGAGRIDRKVFDAGGDAVVWATLAGVQIGGQFDLRRLDAAFNNLGAAILTFGARVRRLQTGRVENYLLVLFAGAIGVLLLAALVTLSVTPR